MASAKTLTQANELIGEIIQKVGKQEYASKGYSNPLAHLKRGFIDNATKIEEIYVARALAQTKDPTGLDTLKRVTQDIKTKYYQENYTQVYSVTISDQEVKEGFTSKDGIEKLADKKIEALNRGSSVDEYNKMQETISLIPTMTPIKKVTLTNSLDTKEGVLDLLELVEFDSSNMIYSSKEYNTEFENDIPKDKQMIFTTPKTYAKIKRQLAEIFNVSLVDLARRVTLIKEFGDNTTQLILADEDILRVHPTLYNHGLQPNAKYMYTNHHLNVGYILAVCEMYGAVVYSHGA